MTDEEKLAQKKLRAKEATKRYKLRNLEKVRAKAREYYWKDPEKGRERNAKWRLENREKSRADSARYRQEHLEEERAKDRERYHGDPAFREKKAAGRRAHREANPEKFKAKEQERYAKDPVGQRQRTKTWKLQNPEKQRVRQKTYYEMNGARRRAENTAWRKANPEIVHAYAAERRALEKNAEGFWTPADIERIYKAQKGCCAYCRKPLGKRFHRDHIIALVNGGTNWPSNIQLTCKPCNLAKRAADPIEFARRLGRLL